MKYDYHKEEAKTNILSKMRCQPGEVWNETLQQCLAYGGGTLDDKKQTPDQAISTESNSRKTPPAPALSQQFPGNRVGAATR